MDEKLYNILLNEREKLPEFLYKINDYRKLSNLIRKLEKKKEENIWYDLCLGKIGKPNNKYSAIYEIPTKQLIDSLALIIQLYDVKQVDEVGAGLGLLSTLLNKKMEEDEYKVKITASDNFILNETNLSLDYTNIIKKDISDIIWQHKNNVYPPDMVICSHPIKNHVYDELYKLIDSFCVKIVVLITNLRTSNILFKENETENINKNYTMIRLPIYQISYLDIFEKNDLKDLYTRSVTNIFIRNDVYRIEESDMYNILQDNIYKYVEIDCKRILLQEYAFKNLIPNWIVTDKSINIVYNIFTITKDIPLWIPNIKLLIFWFIQIKLDIFPLNIDSPEKLINYYNMFMEKKNMPEWIPKYLVNSYIWLYFSDDNVENKSVEDIIKKIIIKYFKNTFG